MSVESQLPKLEECKNYGDIFEIVKKSVKKTIGRERSGLMLFLGNLPLNVGAFHQLDSNGIVINKRLVNLMFGSGSLVSPNDVNSLIFTLLTHEYLHSLGYIDERVVRKMVYDITKQTFGSEHPATKMAVQIPFPKIVPPEMHQGGADMQLELISDFERSSTSYIT